MDYKEEIERYHRNRYHLLDKRNNLELENSLINELNSQIDELGDKILKILTTNVNVLEFDFIMQHLSYLGECVNLINDDNGHWAVCGDGYQSVAYGDEPVDVETHFFIEAIHWKDTPKEALIHYLTYSK